MKYFKLGKTAHIFWDPKSGLKITNKQISAIKDAKITKRVREAVANGHITEATLEEYEKYQESIETSRNPKTPQPIVKISEGGEGEGEDEDDDDDLELEDMTKDQLLKHAEKTLTGITEKDLAALAKMKKEEMISYIREY
jgi:hypothetical protein